MKQLIKNITIQIYKVLTYLIPVNKKMIIFQSSNGRNYTGNPRYIYEEMDITVNKNAIPNDPQSPFITSGVRIGTPAVTSRGLVEADMEKIGELIYWAASPEFESKKDYIRSEVNKICEAYPLY